jgi:hypothetical protein
MTPVLAVTLWCADCGDDRLFDALPCTDGHADCPERACVECGMAVLLVDAAAEPAPVMTAVA